MSIIELILTSFSLAMDAFSVSICKGLSINKLTISKKLLIASYFSVFQMMMPLYGYYLGNKFYIYVKDVDHFIVLFILSLIGLNMIKEAFSKDISLDDKLDIKTMLLLSIATSIDALAVGITFDMLNVNLLLACSLIGIITFIMCYIGVILGNKIGLKFRNKSLILGGVILILIGIKTLFGHIF